MSRYDADWCAALAGGVGTSSGLTAPIRILYVVTDTEEGKAAFWLSDDGKTFGALAGKLPRGEKADITITAKESVLLALWAGRRTRDEAFMAGDVKVEGAYAHWLDQVVPTFEAAPWSEAWATASKL